MIKYICDKCKKETSKQDLYETRVEFYAICFEKQDGNDKEYNSCWEPHICKKCWKDVRKQYSKWAKEFQSKINKFIQEGKLLER